MRTKKLLVICLSFVVVSFVGYQVFQRNTGRELQSAGFRGYCPDCVFKKIDKDVSKLSEIVNKNYVQLVDHDSNIPKGCKHYMKCKERTAFGSVCCKLRQYCIWSKEDTNCFHCPQSIDCYARQNQHCCEIDSNCHWDSYHESCTPYSLTECLKTKKWYDCECKPSYTCNQPTARCCSWAKEGNQCVWDQNRNRCIHSPYYH